MIKKLISFVQGQGSSSRELREALSKIDVDAERQSLDRLELERRALLLSADDAALDDIEAQIVIARRRLDRAIIIRDQIMEQIPLAEAREEAEALSSERESVEAEAAAVAKLLKTTYPKLLTDMVSILERLSRSEDSVSSVNRKLLAAKRNPEEYLPSVESRSMRMSARQLEVAQSILSRTRLPRIAGITDGWMEDEETMPPMIVNTTGADASSSYGVR